MNFSWRVKSTRVVEGGAETTVRESEGQLAQLCSILTYYLGGGLVTGRFLRMKGSVNIDVVRAAVQWALLYLSF